MKKNLNLISINIILIINLLKKRKKAYILVLITLPIILSENITFSSYKLQSNKLKYFHSFIYNNYSKNNGPIKQGFNYTLDLPNLNLKDEHLISKIYIILAQSNFNIKSKIIDDFSIEGIELFKNSNMKIYERILFYDYIDLKNENKERNNIYLKDGNTSFWILFNKIINLNSQKNIIFLQINYIVNNIFKAWK